MYVFNRQKAKKEIPAKTEIPGQRKGTDHMHTIGITTRIGLCTVAFWGLLLCGGQSLTAGAGQTTIDSTGRVAALRAHHPAVGSWFGKVVETCIGDPATNCAGLGLPAISFFMMPSFNADGNFLGNDSLAVGSAPFGPHTTAHGQWVPTSRTELVADSVFLLPAPVAGSVSAVHLKYLATITETGTMVGYVNIYVAFPPLPLSWEPLGQDEFPSLSSIATDLVASPSTVYTDQAQCTTAGCPLVFKFKALRVGI